ncbi:hypothetical protein N0824_00215 [Microcystis sp. 0824]|nr:hypothetical protein N0824_00215 [Microcystis sp. 0824]
MFKKNSYKLYEKIDKSCRKIFLKHLTFFENFRYSSLKSNKKLSASLTLA